VKTHREEALKLLNLQIGNEEEVEEINQTAQEVSQKWINPLSGGKEDTNGLIYGLVQSGKTGVLTVSGALGADEGYRTLLILTSDIKPLYEQTLARIQEALPGIDILGKTDLKNWPAFLQRIKTSTCAIVASKNAKVLETLIENFKQGKVKGLSCLIIDDEADQATPNTKASKDDGTRSKINQRIAELRGFFEKNTYLQVTATPEALFLQAPGHELRPKFTVLSHPGADYVGGGDFFGDDSDLVREFDINDLQSLSAGSQPVPGQELPKSLLKALDTFMIGATFKRTADADQNCAFLCHVSTKTSDHKHIETLLRKYKTDLARATKAKDSKVLERLREAYDDLAASHQGVADTDFESIIESIAFYSPGITVKLVNGQTDEDVAVRSPYNLFVGGNKLGRGVTIKNLLVSYYGRNPKQPQADTVLQHARMYGYRRKDIGLLRLFLPKELHIVFRAIDKMEKGLRSLIAENPDTEFRGIYVEGSVKPTRKNVLAPGAVGSYTGGSNYNPAQVLRDPSVNAQTRKIDEIAKGIASGTYKELPIADLKAIIRLIRPDESKSEKMWDSEAIANSMDQFGQLRKQKTGYLYVARDRALIGDRRETQGILTGGEFNKVPTDKISLFLLRTKAEGANGAAWWPQVRFPNGNYAFAFAV
jgi:hypothetical protein